MFWILQSQNACLSCRWPRGTVIVKWTVLHKHLFKEGAWLLVSHSWSSNTHSSTTVERHMNTQHLWLRMTTVAGFMNTWNILYVWCSHILHILWIHKRHIFYFGQLLEICWCAKRQILIHMHLHVQSHLWISACTHTHTLTNQGKVHKKTLPQNFTYQHHP